MIMPCYLIKLCALLASYFQVLIKLIIRGFGFNHLDN